MTPKKRPTTKTKGPNLKKLRQDLLKYQQIADQNLAGWQRARADLENFKKQSRKRHQAALEQANAEFLSQLLPVIDNYQQALEQVSEEDRQNSWVKGFEYILSQINDLLTDFQVARIESLGKKFDPALHEAVETVASEKPKETVVEEIRQGFTLKKQVILPSRVKVSAGPSKPINKQKK
jgi:molecular chaperone GrpE